MKTKCIYGRIKSKKERKKKRVVNRYMYGSTWSRDLVSSSKTAPPRNRSIYGKNERNNGASAR